MTKPAYEVWKKISAKEIKQRIQGCLKKNIDLKEQPILGVPVSQLDENVFSLDERLLDSSVFLQTMVDNPNHIGCHTLGQSEPFFAGTQVLEREVIEITACDILGGAPGQQDGYVAAGGTESNIQAMWIYRNYFRIEEGVSNREIAILCSSDSHYSMPKGANLLDLRLLWVPVDENTRQIQKNRLKEMILQAKQDGISCFIVVSNLMTTMFGSVDDVDLYAECLNAERVKFLIHIDAAFGGFIYPFSYPESRISFANENITSFTLDAHKLLQAPFGTGIFLIRKGWMQYAVTDQAQYVQGMDNTLSGSRSGANAIAVWMILVTYGPHGWYEKIHLLNHRTEWLSRQLDAIGIQHYRHPASNIVTIRAGQLSKAAIEKYGLVPDKHDNPAWYKIVVMSHVTVDLLEPFIRGLRD